MTRPRLRILSRASTAALPATGHAAGRPANTADTPHHDRAAAGLRAGVGRVMRRALVTVAAVLVLGTAAAGCSSGRHPSATASPSVNDQALALSVGRQFAQCARQHGRPDFPDPVVQDGALAFPGASKEDQNAVQDACVSILQRLPASMQHQNRNPTAEELAKLRQFSQCMRQHGVPDWPDPRSDGTFPIVGTPLAAEGKSQRILDGRQACDQYFSGGIDAS